MGDENKQFEASQQKLRKAREQGQVVKSKDLSTAIAIIVMFAAIYMLGPIIWGQLSALFVMIYEQIPNKHLEEIGYSYIFTKSVIPATLITLPILVLAGFIGIFGDVYYSMLIGFIVLAMLVYLMIKKIMNKEEPILYIFLLALHLWVLYFTVIYQ